MTSRNAERQPSSGLSSLLPVGMSGSSFTSLVKHYDPRKLADVGRWRERAGLARRCEGPPEGHLLLWMGRLKRWKRRWFSATSPGLLVYCKGPFNRANSSAINLQRARVQHGGGRQLLITTNNGLVCFLRCASAADCEAWVSAIEECISTYARMLGRANLLMQSSSAGNGQARVNFADPPPSLSRNSRAEVARIEDTAILSRLNARLQSATQALAPHQASVDSHIEGLATALLGLAASLNMSSSHPTQPLSTRGELQPAGAHAPESPFSKAARLPPPSPDSPSLSHSRAPSHVGSVAQLPSSSNSSSSSDNEADTPEQVHRRSFTRLPPPHAAPTASPLQPAALGAAWRSYTGAVADALRSEAVRVVEAEAENAALQARLRELARQLQAARGQLRAHGIAEPGRSSAEAGSSSERDPDGVDDASAWTDEARPSSAEATSADGRRLAANISGLDEEYFEALEAFEAVQAHDYLVRAADGPAAASCQEASRDELPLLRRASEGPAAEDGELTEADGELTEDQEDGDGSSSALTFRASLDSPWAEAAARVRLPAPQPASRGFSIWSVLRNAIGRDLTRITLPATINEPTSALQRLAEDLQYRHLLEAACEAAPGPERMRHIVAFALCSYGGTLQRIAKPFNPLLGETYEWRSADGSCRFLAEQVSHHPPVSCWWAEGQGGWRWWGELEMRSRFWGKSVEMAPVGQIWLQLPDGSTFSWNKLVLTIHNLVLGRLWLDWHGDIVVKELSSGATAHVSVPRCGGILEARGKLSGAITDSRGSKAYALAGSYTSSITATPVGSTADSAGRTIFTADLLPEDAELQYSMTALAITLNAPVPGIMEAVAPTDSRHRTDQRALEVGELAFATPEKVRLEERQRAARRIRKEREELFHPLWFQLREPGKAHARGADHWLGQTLIRLPDKEGPSMWVYNDEYFSERHDWARCPDLYGSD